MNNINLQPYRWISSGGVINAVRILTISSNITKPTQKKQKFIRRVRANINKIDETDLRLRVEIVNQGRYPAPRITL